VGSKELTKKTIKTVAFQSEDSDTNPRMDAMNTEIHIHGFQWRYPLNPEALH